LTQFFQVFPDYAKNDFYVTGESYGGKYGTTLEQSNDRAMMHCVD